MDFIDQLQALVKCVEKQDGNIASVEETKKAYVIPFIQALGYDVLDPKEVLPNFRADHGDKKAEKVDYAIFIDDKPALLFACISGDSDLNDAHAAQLRRSFHAASARIGVLTNGKAYSFYADLEKQYIMDAEPFLRFNLLKIDALMISEVKKLAKSYFQFDQIFTAANQFKYIREIKDVLFEQSTSPSVELIRVLAGQMVLGALPQQMFDRLAPIVREAFRQFVDDYIANSGVVKRSHNDTNITDEEFEGFFVVSVT